MATPTVLEGVVRAVRAFGKEVIVVRPGVSLFLYSDEPLRPLGSRVADLLKGYLATIPDGALNAYQARDGYKSLTKRVFDQHFALLRDIPPEYEFLELHYKDGVDAACGHFAFNFVGARLDKADKPLETNLIAFDWPAEMAGDPDGPDRIAEFAARAVEGGAIVSGNAGFAFQHPQTFPSEVLGFIQSMMPRYLAFDPSYSRCRYTMRGHSPSAHWLNVLGEALLQKVGGIEELRARLPGARIQECGAGVMIRATEMPPIGDVNRGATDLGSIPDVARALRPVRFEISGFGGQVVDAEAWLSRFDDRQSVK